MDVALLVLAASGTALATGLGAVPVFFMGARAEVLRPILLGSAIGAMTVASIVGLLMPALEEGSIESVATGFLAGVLLLLAAGRLLGGRDVHVGELRGAGVRLSVLVFGVLLVHSLPEGLAIGTAYASDRAGLSLFVILAIALQNIPEGTSIALPMDQAGFSRSSQFWAAVLTSASAGRCCGGVSRRRAHPRASAGVIRLRGRRDARARRVRARSAGGSSTCAWGGRRSARRSRRDAGARRGYGRLAAFCAPIFRESRKARRPATDGARARAFETAAMNRNEKGVAMWNLLKYGGIAASVVLIAFGTASIAVGAWGISTVRDNLKQEQIYFGDHATDPNVPADLSGQQVTTGSQAHEFAGVMRKHTLEATEGQVYAQMGRFLDANGNATSDESKAAKDEAGQPVANEARNIWVTETALTTALNMAYFGERVGVFGIVMGIALLLTGIGFLVLTLGGALQRSPAAAKEPAGHAAAATN